MPQRDATLSTAPGEVRILFGGEIERAFSTIEVTDSAGHRVDKGDARVDETNRRLLRVGLGPLSPGAYRVLWRILAVDGHRNEGTYVFTVKPQDGRSNPRALLDQLTVLAREPLTTPVVSEHIHQAAPRLSGTIVLMGLALVVGITLGYVRWAEKPGNSGSRSRRRRSSCRGHPQLTRVDGPSVAQSETCSGTRTSCSSHTRRSPE